MLAPYPKVYKMIISFLNQKGGTGKTTVSTNVAAELAYRGFKTLFVDADPQGTAMRGASERPEDKPLLYNVIGMPNTSISQQIPKMQEENGYDFVIIDGPPRMTSLAKNIIITSDVIVMPMRASGYDEWAVSTHSRLEAAEASSESLTTSGFAAPTSPNSRKKHKHEYSTALSAISTFAIS